MGVSLVVGPLKHALLSALNEVQRMEDTTRAIEHKADLDVKAQQLFMSDWLTR